MKAKPQGKTVTVELGPKTLAWLEELQENARETDGLDISLTAIVRGMITLGMRTTKGARPAPETTYE